MDLKTLGLAMMTLFSWGTASFINFGWSNRFVWSGRFLHAVDPKGCVGSCPIDSPLSRFDSAIGIYVPQGAINSRESGWDLFVGNCTLPPQSVASEMTRLLAV